jgi:general stress protein YciG
MAERSKRGFASMDREKQRQIASKGGKAAHAKGTAHEFTREEAIEAGRKGGKAAHAKGTAHRFTTEEAGHSAAREEQPVAFAMGGAHESPLGGTRVEQPLSHGV